MCRADPVRLKITEIFYSLQGEADTRRNPDRIRAPHRLPVALPVLRHRLRVSWRRMVGPRRGAVSEVSRHGTRYVCVTGGEPLAQRACLQLLAAVCDAGYRVSLETSGAIDVSAVDARVVRVVDVKTPGSRRKSSQSPRELRRAAPHRPGQVRHLRSRRLRVEQRHSSASTGSRHAARSCSLRATSSFRPQSSPTGSSPIGCRCGSRSSLHKYLWGNVPGK